MKDLIAINIWFKNIFTIRGVILIIKRIKKLVILLTHEDIKIKNDLDCHIHTVN